MQFDLGMLPGEAREQRSGEKAFGNRGDREIELSARSSLQIGRGLQGIGHLGQRGGDLSIQAFAGFREGDAAGGAGQEGDAERFFQLADRLADGRSGDPDAICCRAEILFLCNQGEDGKCVQIVQHWLVFLPSEESFQRLIATMEQPYLPDKRIRREARKEMSWIRSS